MSTEAIRSWYVSPHRLLELLRYEQLPREVLWALQSPDQQGSRILLANAFGPHIIQFLRSQKICPLHQLAMEERLTPGIPFTYHGHFYGKGFGASNRTPYVSLAEDIHDVLPGKKLLLEFSKNGLVTDTAYSRLSGSTNLFAFCSVFEINDTHIRAVPYLVGDLIERTDNGIDLNLVDNLSLPINRIDQFSNIDYRWQPSAKQFARLGDILEADIKALICKLLGEIEIPKDWGGEQCDIFSSNLTVNGNKMCGAFLLKGKAKFHEMTLADCGKNGDQINRLFQVPAQVYIVQHCHKISPAVREVVEAFAIKEYSRTRFFTFIDGYDTARILHSNGLL